jgi:hypothetical protein
MIHRHWPDIAERAIKSIQEFSDAPIVLIDDASPAKESVAGFWQIVNQYNLIGHAIAPPKIQHGLCLDMALRMVECDWVFTADHDIVIHDERAFSGMLELAADDVGAIGCKYSNKASRHLGKYIHPYWALWNAKVIRKHNLSFAPFFLGLCDGEDPWVFATAQFLSYRLGSMSRLYPWEANDGPFKMLPFNLEGLVKHKQVWQERGDTWRENVILSG